MSKSKPTPQRRPMMPPSQAQPVAQAAAPARPVTNDFGIKTEHEQLLGELRYRTTLYSAEVGFDHLPWMLRVLSGPVGAALETVGGVVALQGDLTRAQVSGEGVSVALDNLAAAIVEAGGAAKVRELLANTLVQHPKLGWRPIDEQFNALFQGRYLHLLRVIAWVLEVNYGPFGLGGVSDLWSRLMEISNGFEDASSEQPPDSTSTPATGST